MENKYGDKIRLKYLKESTPEKAPRLLAVKLSYSKAFSKSESCIPCFINLRIQRFYVVFVVVSDDVAAEF